MRPLSAHCHLGLGRLYRQAGKTEAEVYLGSAIRMYREMAMSVWLEMAQTVSDP
jgi:hypothetical protein